MVEITRVTLVCLSRLIIVFIAQSYTNYIQISGGNYVPFDDGNHTASLVIGVYDGTNENSVIRARRRNLKSSGI